MYTPTSPQLGAIPLYSDGRRFSLAGWSATDWAIFLGGAGAAASQIYGTVTHTTVPVAPIPTPQVQTPIGNVPTWAIVAAVGVGALLLLSGRRH